ncbi:MAG TPA: SusE domain-containing protein, partial [Chitinophagaceae bacterium]
MKAALKSSFLLLIASALLWSSCTKNDVKAYVNPGAAPMFNSTITTLVLIQANAATTAGTFSWTVADFGYKASVTYSIQFCKAGTNFAASSTTEVNMGS